MNDISPFFSIVSNFFEFSFVSKSQNNHRVQSLYIVYQFVILSSSFLFVAFHNREYHNPKIQNLIETTYKVICISQVFLSSR